MREDDSRVPHAEDSDEEARAIETLSVAALALPDPDEFVGL